MQARLNQKLAEQGNSSSGSRTRNATKAATNAMNKLFEEAENTPGGLERFEHLVERDLKRCVRKLKEFKQVQRQFDAIMSYCQLLPLKVPPIIQAVLLEVLSEDCHRA